MAVRLTRDHKPDLPGEAERIKSQGGEINYKCVKYPTGPPTAVFLLHQPLKSNECK